MSPVNAVSQNHLLAALPSKDLDLLLPHLEAVELKQRQVLCNIGDTHKAVYFIQHGVVSVLTIMEDGSSIEVGMIGPEGITPISALLGEQVSQQNVVVQLPGHALKINVHQCMLAFDKSEAIRKNVLQFANLFLNVSAQTAGCNRLHSVEQRLVRWLLMSSDRFQSSTLPLTQEYISSMLGVRRVGVTESAGELQRAGLIRYNHGTIEMIDRDGMEKMACECYRIDKDRFNRLFSKK